MTGGGDIAGMTVPPEVWHRIAHSISLDSAADLLSFAMVSKAAAEGVARVEAERHRRILDTFGARSFSVPARLVERTVLVHVVPPLGESLFAIAECHPDEVEGEVRHTLASEIRGEHVQGFDTVWIKNGITVRKPLRIPGLPPPAAVSNVKFSPDGRYVAMLVGLNSGRAWMEEDDPIGRLNGLMRSSRGIPFGDDDASLGSEDSDRDDIAFVPSNECALVVVEMKQSEQGDPLDMEINVFAHAFVPEYGFDMRWTKTAETGDGGRKHDAELAFAGILHAKSTVALYMARWKQSAAKEEEDFQFIACLPEIARELIEDKRDAMRVCDSTRVTSRVEMSEDLRTIFFDTSAKFGVIRVNQVSDSPASLELGRSLGIYHSSPKALPFSASPQQAPPRRLLRARLSMRASFPALVSRLQGPSNTLSRDGSDSGCFLGARTPRTERAQTTLRETLPWRRWFSVSAGSPRNRQESSPTSSSSAAATTRDTNDPGAGIASAMRRFLRSPVGWVRPNRVAESSAAPSIPWHRRSIDTDEDGEDEHESHDLEMDEEEEEAEDEEVGSIVWADGSDADLFPMSVDRHSSPHKGSLSCSRCQDCGCLKPCIEHRFSGASPRVLHFDSDSGGAMSLAASPGFSERSSWSEGMQSPVPEGGDRRPASPPVRDRSFSIASRGGSARSPPPQSPPLRVVIKSPPRVSRPELPLASSRVRRMAFSKPAFVSQSPRVTCMSPDGTLLCSVYVAALAATHGQPAAHMTCVEVRSTADGSVVFRNCRTTRTSLPTAAGGHRLRFEKTHEVVAHTCGFSADSSLLWVRDAHISAHVCVITRRLPAVFRARDGAVVRGFSDDAACYKHVQMAGDGLAAYATRYVAGTGGAKGDVVVDAIDVVSGAVVGSAAVAGPMECPDVFNAQAVYLLGESEVRGVSRGGVDTLWECTRGGVGCHWCPHPDNGVMMT